MPKQFDAQTFMKKAEGLLRVIVRQKKLPLIILRGSCTSCRGPQGEFDTLFLGTPGDGGHAGLIEGPVLKVWADRDGSAHFEFEHPERKLAFHNSNHMVPLGGKKWNPLKELHRFAIAKAPLLHSA